MVSQDYEYQNVQDNFSYDNNNWKSELIRVFTPESPLDGDLVPNPFSWFNSIQTYNTAHLHNYNGFADYEAKDGWVLLFKDLGYKYNNFGSYVTINNPIPTFIMYNRYTGKVRVFAYAKKPAGETFQSQLVDLSHFPIVAPGVSKDVTTTALFGYLEMPSSSLDKFNKHLQAHAVNPVASQGNTRFWVFLEFVAMYDPCVCEYESKIHLKTYNKNVTQINAVINGSATGVFDYLKEKTYDQQTSTLGTMFTDGSPVVKSYKVYKNAKEILGAFSDTLSPFMNLAGEIVPDALSKLGKVTATGVKYEPWIAAAVFAVDLLLGANSGPKQEDRLSGVQLEFNATLTGSLEHTVQSFNQDFPTPGSKDLITSPGIKASYNNPLGVFSLIEAPKLILGDFPGSLQQTFHYSQFTGSITYNMQEHLAKLSRVNYAINPAAHVSPIELKAALIFEPRFNSMGSSLKENDLGLIKEKDGNWRTPYMPLADLEDYTFKLRYEYLSPNFSELVNGTLHPWRGVNVFLHVVVVFEPEPEVLHSGKDCFEYSAVTENILFSTKYKVDVSSTVLNFGTFSALSPWFQDSFFSQPASHPLFQRREVLEFPPNNQPLTLISNFEVAAHNRVRINQDLLNLNGYKLFVKATSVEFTGLTPIPGIEDFLDENGVFTLPIASRPRYSQYGYLDGYCTGFCNISGPGYTGITPTCLDLPDLGGYMFDFRQLGLGERATRPVSSSYIKSFCNNIYQPIVRVSGLMENDANSNEVSDFVTAFPNPITPNTQLRVIIKSESEMYDIEVLNVMGQSVYKNSFPNTGGGSNFEIEVEEAKYWEKGFYYLTVKPAGKQELTIQLIKQ